jgi:hypothetical protein
VDDPVPVVRKLFEAYRDQRVEDMVALTDPHVVWMPIVRPGRAVQHGHDGVRRLIPAATDAYGAFRLEGDSFSLRDDGRVVVRGSAHAADLVLHFEAIVEVRDGLVVSVDVDEAKPT